MFPGSAARFVRGLLAMRRARKRPEPCPPWQKQDDVAGHFCQRTAWFASRDCQKLLSTQVRGVMEAPIRLTDLSVVRELPELIFKHQENEQTRGCLWLCQTPQWGETALRLKCFWSPLKTLSICSPRPLYSPLVIHRVNKQSSAYLSWTLQATRYRNLTLPPCHFIGCKEFQINDRDRFHRSMWLNGVFQILPKNIMNIQTDF